MLKRLSALVIAGAALSACSESTQPTGVVPIPGGANQAILAELTCSVNAGAGTMSCASASPAAVAGRSSDLILGGQNTYVKLTSTNVVTTPTVSVTADVSVRNLTGQPWNTADGTTVDTAGVKVFFVQQPTNGVTISNPTNTGTFTAAGQPYFKYSGTTLLGADQILSAGETSGLMNWNFTLNGATTFTFGVLIVAKMPDEQGTLRWVRDTLAQTAAVEYLTSVWGTSPTDVWVGGGTGGPTALQHWNGSSWTPTNGGQTSGIWGSASNNVWSVGGTEILHYTGTWALDDTSVDPLYSIWGSAANDIWIGGGAGWLYHYDGSFWTQISRTTTGLASTNAVRAIWGTSASNVYAGTLDAATTGGLGLHHYNGSVWTTVTAANINQVRAIWGSSASDVYVGGSSGVLRHWNGSTWSTVVAGFGTGGADAIAGIWGSASDNVYVVESNGTLWHYNGTSWIAQPNSGMAFYGVWGSGRDVFAVGYGTGGVINNVVLQGTR